MNTSMLLVVGVGAGLLAGPALAAGDGLCSGYACKYLKIFPADGGCVEFHSGSLERVRVVISSQETIAFEIEPRGRHVPRLRSGACLRDAAPYKANIDRNGRGDPARR